MNEEKTARRSLGKWLKDEFQLTIILLRSIPAPVVALFVISVIAMNILANKQDVRATAAGFMVCCAMDIPIQYLPSAQTGS